MLYLYHRAGNHGDDLNPGCDAMGDKMGYLEVTVKLSLADEVGMISQCCKHPGPPEGGQLRKLRTLNSLPHLS